MAKIAIYTWFKQKKKKTVHTILLVFTNTVLIMHLSWNKNTASDREHDFTQKTCILLMHVDCLVKDLQQDTLPWWFTRH